MPSYHYDPSAVTAWEALVGHRADVVQTFVPWAYPPSPRLAGFPADQAAELSHGGRVVEVTWTPDDPTSDDADADLSLGAIADGAQDAYARRFARAVRDSGLRVRLRFAHEMNGSWSDWSEGADDNAPGDYVRAWRHLHDLFAEQGATDVVWVWSPNVVGDLTAPLDGLYPGDAWVDEVAVDGYSYPRTGCPSPQTLFSPTLREVRRISTRPVALAEVGVSTGCPDRGDWVASLFTWARSQGLVGVTWWERATQDDDYRLAGDPGALAAYRRAVAG